MVFIESKVYPQAVNLLLQIGTHGVKTVSKSIRLATSGGRRRITAARSMGVPDMDIEARLRKLEARYRAALSAAVAAKAHYLALAGEPSATPAAVERANALWKQLESRKRTIAAQMGELEAREDANAS
jgi:hypothetical protein